MNSEKRDVISDLPDALICHILSFLPTKEAASTSVLAKRWEHLLVFVPNLELDDSFYFQPHYEKSRKSSRNFIRFVESVLTLQAKANAPLNRFYFKCGRVSDFWMFDWISKVLKRGVLDIDLHISFPSCYCSDFKFYPLPSKIFVSKTLVRLKIKFKDGFNIDVEGHVSLPKLKILHLDDFEIKPGMFNKLLSGCNALEELVLVNLDWYWEDEPRSVTVSTPTLKRLKFFSCEGYLESVSLSFDNPNLVYLECSDSIAGIYQPMSFDSLVEARLRLGKTKKINATNLLMGIRNVKVLYFDTLKVLACCREIIPVFNNVIQLTIKTTPDLNWDPLPTLLKKCPNLETLVFEGLHHKYSNRCEDEDGCLCCPSLGGSKGATIALRRACLCKYHDARTCLSSSSVKVLKILKFGKTFGDDGDDEDTLEKQIKQVKHFLEAMPNLEQMILYYNTPNDEDVMKVSRKLEDQLPRVASVKCNVQIFSANLSLSFSGFLAMDISQAINTNMRSSSAHKDKDIEEKQNDGSTIIKLSNQFAALDFLCEG